MSCAGSSDWAMSEPLVLRWAVRVVQVGGMMGSFTVRVSCAFANAAKSAMRNVVRRRCMRTNLSPRGGERVAMGLSRVLPTSFA